MTYPLVLELALDRVPVTVTCRVLRYFSFHLHQLDKRRAVQRDLVLRSGHYSLVQE